MLILFIAGLVALGWVWNYVQPFKQKAQTYDLAKVGKLPSASFIYDRNGDLIGQIAIQNRYVIPLSEMPEHLRKAVMAAEDARFYDHQGVDLYGITRAAIRNALAREAQQGASTITQQLARNTFGMMERSIDRKITEMFLAWRLEDSMPKDQIMENYLNLIFLGRGYYGVEAAARGYFGKHAKDLNVSECAALAGLIASPNNREPWNYYDGFKGNRDRVIGRMKELGFISGKEAKDALADPLKVVERVPIKSQSYILDYVRQQVIDIVGWEGATSDGYHVYTTIDPKMQKAAQDSLEANLRQVEDRMGYKHQKYAAYKKERDSIVDKAQKESKERGDAEMISPFKLVKVPDYLQGSVIALENETGGILAMVGGREFDHSEFNRAVYAKRSSGTAFLPIVYAAAFERGMFPGTLVDDGVLDNRRVMIGGTEGILGEWGPESSTNGYEGRIPARFALTKSKNAAGVRVGYTAGLENVLKTAKNLGVRSELRQLPATYLGDSDTSLLEMALAYTNFPNGGWHEKPHIITKIDDSDSKEIFKFKSSRQRGLDERVAYEMHSVLSDSLHFGTAARAEKELGLKKVNGQLMDGGGKTGTAYKSTDLSFFGYSSEVTVGVWAGFDQKRTIFEGAFSNQVVLPVWTDVMNVANERFPAKNIPMPMGLEKISTCLRSGEIADREKCIEKRPGPNGEMQQWTCTYTELSTPDQKPKHVCRIHTGTGLSIRDIWEQKNKSTGAAPAAAAIPVVVQDQQPVLVMSKTVIGIDEDPYHSLKPLEAEKRGQALYDGEEKKDLMVPAKEIMKATPVGPLDRQDTSIPDNLARPAPLDLDNL